MTEPLLTGERPHPGKSNEEPDRLLAKKLSGLQSPGPRGSAENHGCCASLAGWAGAHSGSRDSGSRKCGVASKPGFPFWILASSILRSFSLERKPFLTAGTHRAGPKCFHWTLSFSEGDNSSVGRQFFRHSSELHSAASRFRTRERPFYPLGSGSAQILCSMSPNSLRFRCPSANSSQ